MQKNLKKLRKVIHECIGDSTISESTILALYITLDTIKDIDTVKMDWVNWNDNERK